MTTEQSQELDKTGAAAAKTIIEMVAAVDEPYTTDNTTDAAIRDYLRLDDEQELAEYDRNGALELMNREDPDNRREAAEQTIQEDPISLEWRSDWTEPGEELRPYEFRLTLTTGGPAVCIIGVVENGEVERARLMVQDWFTPWVEYLNIDHAVLRRYCEIVGVNAM